MTPHGDVTLHFTFEEHFMYTSIASSRTTPTSMPDHKIGGPVEDIP